MSERTREEIDQEYSQAAIMLGHKARVLAQVKADAKRLESEIDEHTQILLKLNQEGLALQAVVKTQAEGSET
jgi:hypothetical protein